MTVCRLDRADSAVLSIYVGKSLGAVLGWASPRGTWGVIDTLDLKRIPLPTNKEGVDILVEMVRTLMCTDKYTRVLVVTPLNIKTPEAGVASKLIDSLEDHTSYRHQLIFFMKAVFLDSFYLDRRAPHKMDEVTLANAITRKLGIKGNPNIVCAIGAFHILARALVFFEEVREEDREGALLLQWLKWNGVIKAR